MRLTYQIFRLYVRVLYFVANQFIPISDLSAQISNLKNELTTALERVLLSGEFVMGSEVEAFEKEVANYLGVKYAVGVNSGTDALIIGLRALGITKGDEVITTPFSFFATAESISRVGARPVFIDVEESSFNLDPNKIEKAITHFTKAIMPVHLYGQPAAMASIMDIARKYDLKVIEDCAQAFGAYCSSLRKYTGAIGDIGAYSFFPTKNLGAFGDGGLIVTDNYHLAEKARMLRVHGTKENYQNEMLGYNSRLDSLQAAVLRVKLPYINFWNAQRRKIAVLYNQLLKETNAIITPKITNGHIFSQYTIRLTEINRDDVRQLLRKRGIDTRVYYQVPQDKLPIYAGQYPENPISNNLSKEVLSLPIWPELEEGLIKEVAQFLLDAIITVQNC